MRNYRFILFLFSLWLCFSSKSIAAEEGCTSLNGVWQFKTDPYYQGEKQQWYNLDSPAISGDSIAVPGNWELRNEYAYYSGAAWYKREFHQSTIEEKKNYRLCFEAVGIHYKLWINGMQVEDMTWGYFPHYFDIKPYLRKGNNTVVVCVDSKLRTGAYWSWGGIRRSVTLVENNLQRVEQLHITPRLNLTKGTAHVEVATTLVGATDRSLRLEYILKDGARCVRQFVHAIDPNIQVQHHTFALDKRDVKLWHFDHPHCYTLEVRLKQGDKVLHSQSDHFGIREVKITDGKLLLNGESVRLLGYNWVADDRMTGNTLPEEVYTRHIDMMKAAGANMARLSHIPLPKAVLDYLDKVGMLVIDEIPVWGRSEFTQLSNPTARQWLTQMVNHHYNHPSIIAWSVGNEIGSVHHNPEVLEYVRSSIEYVSTLDRTRPAIDVSNTAFSKKNDPSQYSQGMISLNIYASGWGANTEKCFALYGKPMYISEFGHSLIGDELTNTFDNSAKALNQLRNRENVFGASLWTFNDYRSTHRSPTSTWDTPPSENRAWGIYDAYGNKKIAYRQAQKEYAPVKKFKVISNPDRLIVTLTPRHPLDLPAYTLKGYRIQVSDYDRGDKLLSQQTTSLPLIKPGDGVYTATIKCRPVMQESRREITLLSPTGYEVIDTTLYSTPPLRPNVYYQVSGNRMARFYFTPQADAERYKLKLVSGKWSKEVEGSIYDYLEIGDLDHGKRYDVTLTAINATGESIPYCGTITATADKYLPPRIMCVKPTSLGGIGIGYLCEKNEYLYQVEVATDREFKQVVCNFQTHIKGACFTPMLNQGKYYVRMKAFRQWQIPTEWSPVYEIKL